MVTQHAFNICDSVPFCSAKRKEISSNTIVSSTQTSCSYFGSLSLTAAQQSVFQPKQESTSSQSQLLLDLHSGITGLHRTKEYGRHGRILDAREPGHRPSCASASSTYFDFLRPFIRLSLERSTP